MSNVCIAGSAREYKTSPHWVCIEPGCVGMSVLGSVAGSMKIPLGHIVGDLAERYPVKASPARTPLLPLRQARNPTLQSSPAQTCLSSPELARERHRSSGTDMSSTGLGMQQRARRTARHAGIVERRAAIEVDRGDLPRTRTQPWTERLVPGQGFLRAPFVCSSGLPDLICYRTDSAFADARGRAGRVPWRLDTEPRRLPIGRKATFLGRRLNQQRSAWFPCLTTVGCDSCRSPWESVWPVDIRPASSAFSWFES